MSEPRVDTTEFFRCKIVDQLIRLLDSEDVSLLLPIQLEVTSKQTDQIQLSIRQYLTEVVITPKKIILRALDPEGWRPEERSKE